MINLNKLSILLVAIATQSSVIFASLETTTCDAENIFPPDYTTECKIKSGLKIITARLKKPTTNYATPLDNIPVVLILGSKKSNITPRLSSPNIYSTLLGIPEIGGSASSEKSPETAKRKISDASWGVTDMITIKYKGDSGPILVCLTLTNERSATIKTLIHCSDFYEKDISEIKILESGMKQQSKAELTKEKVKQADIE
ncbi:hypothetical protein P3W53_14235 [Pseudomonas denitrificans (nom. rej.)]|nr:hypothetical protein [Pseudomonas denitrificans (nom. rej.)]